MQTDTASRVDGPRPTTITADEIAELLGLRPATFLRNRRAMIEAGFPEPLRVPSRRPVWSRRLVDLWIATNGTMAPVDGDNLADPVAAQRQALEARIAGRAA